MIVIEVEFILDWRGLQLPAPGAGKRREAPMAAQGGLRGSQTTRLQIPNEPDGVPPPSIVVAVSSHTAAAERRAVGATTIIWHTRT